LKESLILSKLNSSKTQGFEMKRFIICCDGTWESADSGNDKELSNVARFSRMISQRGQTADGSNIEQVVYYQTGVGGGTQSVIDSLTQGIKEELRQESTKLTGCV
jgi:uncharacterized protein (DUF2235 family)